MKFYDKIFLCIVGIISVGNLYNYVKYDEVKMISYREMDSLVNVTKVSIISSNAYLFTNSSNYPEFNYYIGDNHLFNDFIKTNNIDIKYEMNIFYYLFNLLPNLVFFYLIFRNYLSNHFKTNFKITKAKYTSFSDIAGLQEVKSDVKEFIDIFKKSDKFKDIKCRIPKGALFYGPPGTGKTLIAKAIATECNCNFIQVSGSSFNEVYVGVGQSRVRKLFERARAKKPSIIFIDEIDTLGKRRSDSEGYSEHENTLNSLLSEMDGLEDNSDILVFGATNRLNILDSALLRPGRFDRKIQFNLPTKEERIEMLKLYLDKYPVKGDLDKISNNFAEKTFQFSGADISNLCNEAAIFSVRSNKKSLDECELEKAFNYILLGNKRLSNKLSKQEKHIVAFHEAGHAFMSFIQSETPSPIKVSIIPTTSGALGFSMSQIKEKKLQNKKELLQRMAVLIGGRCSEQIFCDDITTGASDDLEKLKSLVKSYIMDYGFSKKLNNLNLRDDVSEKTKELIDNEIVEIINYITNYTLDVLKDNIVTINRIVKLIKIKEEINLSDLRKVCRKGIENSLVKLDIDL
jgi:ATP-dependent metalloprotease FtsH